MAEYIGNGNYYQGVPARDLSDEEWAAVPRRVKKVVLGLGLYKLAKRKPAKKAEAPAEEAEVKDYDHS